MFYEISTLKVQDYERWKTGFDGIKSILKENGAKSRRIFRELEDPNKVIVIIKWDDLEKAKKLADDDEMRAKFLKLGIIEVDIHHFEEIENNKFDDK